MKTLHMPSRRTVLGWGAASVCTPVFAGPNTAEAFLPQLVLRILIGSALRGAAGRAVAGAAGKAAARAAAKGVASSGARAAVSAAERKAVRSALNTAARRRAGTKAAFAGVAAEQAFGINEAQAAAYAAEARKMAVENPRAYARISEKIGDAALGVLLEKGISFWLNGDENQASIQITNNTDVMQIGTLSITIEQIGDDDDIIMTRTIQNRGFSVNQNSTGFLRHLVKELPYEGFGRINLKIKESNTRIAFEPSDEFLMIS